MEKILELKVYKKQEVLDVIDEEIVEEKQNIIEKIIEKSNQNELEELKEKLEWEYPNIYASQIPSKTSVTKIKEMANGIEQQIVEWETPKFLKSESVFDIKIDYWDTEKMGHYSQSDKIQIKIEEGEQIVSPMLHTYQMEI